MVNSTSIQHLEYSIIGTVMYEADCAGEVVAKLSPEHFSSIAMRGLFEAISALHFEGNPIDPVTVLQRAGEDYEAAVREALKYYTAKSSLPYYCDLLLEQGQLQRLQAEAMSMATAENLQEARETLDRLNGMMVTKKSVEILDASQAAIDFYNRQEGPTPEYLPWGMDALNKALYAELGDFIVIGGYPSAGKTLLSIQFAVGLAEKYRIGYFSLETSPRKLIDRLMSHISQVPLTKIKRRDLNDADWAALAAGAGKLAKLQFDCIDAGGMTVRDIQAVALNKRYQVILVDYLQLVVDNGRGRYEQVTNISQGLHTLARSNGITVIALAQLRRPEKENGKPKPPTMADFRESGQIEQDADIAMLLWPSDLNDNRSRRVLKIGKNKEGDRLKLELDFDGATQTMKVAEPTKGEQYRALQKKIRQAGKAPAQQTMFSELTDDDSDLPF